MTSTTPKKGDDKGKSDRLKPTLSGEPDRSLELRLKKHPDNQSAKVDVGSDESMDASDPVSATSPGGNEPAPSSGFPE